MLYSRLNSSLHYFLIFQNIKRWATDISKCQIYQIQVIRTNINQCLVSAEISLQSYHYKRNVTLTLIH